MLVRIVSGKCRNNHLHDWCGKRIGCNLCTPILFPFCLDNASKSSTCSVYAQLLLGSELNKTSSLTVVEFDVLVSFTNCTAV